MATGAPPAATSSRRRPQSPRPLAAACLEAQVQKLPHPHPAGRGRHVPPGRADASVPGRPVRSGGDHGSDPATVGSIRPPTHWNRPQRRRARAKKMARGVGLKADTDRLPRMVFRQPLGGGAELEGSCARGVGRGFVFN